MKKTIIVIIALVLALFAAYFVYIQYTDQRFVDPQEEVLDDAETPSFTDVQLDNPTEVPISRTYANGTHTIIGTLTVPDPCYEIHHEVEMSESIPQEVNVHLFTRRRDEICATVLTDKDFTVTFNASEDADISLFFNTTELEMVERQ